MYLFSNPAFADSYSCLLHDGKRALVVDAGGTDLTVRVLQQQESILVTPHQPADPAGLHPTRLRHQPLLACTSSVHQGCRAPL